MEYLPSLRTDRGSPKSAGGRPRVGPLWVLVIFLVLRTVDGAKIHVGKELLKDKRV